VVCVKRRFGAGVLVSWCALVWLGCAAGVVGQQQKTQGTQAQADHVVVIRGVVVNSVTNAVLSRALVTSQGNQYAVMTDDTGRFELKIHEKVAAPPAGATVQSSRYVEGRKNGYMWSGTMAVTEYTADSMGSEETEVTIRLAPEAMVLGHVVVPGSEGDVRIECRLLQRELRNGRERWRTVKRFKTWADGEFRFSDLQAGTYKLITVEQMEPEARKAAPGVQQYGYPPVYYPNTRDFAEAGEIVLKAGETAQVNLTMERQPYYPVSIGVRNPPAKGTMEVEVWPTEGRGPGWSLDYDQSKNTVEGALPTGNYTVQVSTRGDGGWVGVGSFAVKNKPLDGGFLMLAPMAEVLVNVHTDFQRSHTVTTDGMPPNAGRTNVVPTSRLVLMTLVSMEYTNGTATWGAQPKSDSGRTYAFENVPPGRYVLQARGLACYVASAESGGVDLLHQTLVVGWGTIAPIEMTLKDDGGEVDVTAEGESAGSVTASDMVNVQLLPTSEWGGGPIGIVGGGTVRMTQVPPGDYLVLAFGSPEMPDLPYGNLELMQGWVSRGEIVHVEAGQKVSVSVKLIRVEGGS
jgi:hypothetical protein